jgi:tripartite-type tricarboxylate transporter receptor subunit TctC
MDRRTALIGGGGALAVAAFGRRLLAQTGAVTRIVFPFGAGGGGDSLCRVLAEQAGALLGRSFIVENRTGADGRIGINSVRTAPADGTTFLVTTGPTMWLMPLVHKAPGYDPFGDFEPVSQLALFEFCISVANTTGIKSMGEMAAWVKANPDKATYAIPGAGTLPHFIGVSLSKAFGVDMRRLPYRGGAPAINDLVGGQVPLSVGTVADALQQHRAGNILAIATTGAGRSQFMPEVPTLKEAGYSIVADAWYGMWAPKGTPTKEVAEMSQAMATILARPEVKTRLEGFGLVATGTSAARLVEIMREQVARWQPVIEESGYRMDN